MTDPQQTPYSNPGRLNMGSAALSGSFSGSLNTARLFPSSDRDSASNASTDEQFFGYSQFNGSPSIHESPYPYGSPNGSVIGSEAANPIETAKTTILREISVLSDCGAIEVIREVIEHANSFLPKSVSPTETKRKRRQGPSQFKLALKKDFFSWGHYRNEATGEIMLHSAFSRHPQDKRGKITWFCPFTGKYISVTKRAETLRRYKDQGMVETNYGEPDEQDDEQPKSQNKTKSTSKKQDKITEPPSDKIQPLSMSESFNNDQQQFDGMSLSASSY